MRYKLDIKRDVDVDGYPEDGEGMGSYILNLPYGFRFTDDLCHTKGFDTMQELKRASKIEVMPCDCKDCMNGLADLTYKLQHPAAESA